MSFLNREVVSRGYIATPHKRLNSISDISIAPSTKKPKYVQRQHVNPFEKYYVSPFLRMMRKEEEDEEVDPIEQKSKLRQLAEAATNSEIGKKIIETARKAYEHPIDTLYNVVTLPADAIQMLDRKINSGSNDVAKILKSLEETGKMPPVKDGEYIIVADPNDDDDDKEEEEEKERSYLYDIVSKLGAIPAWASDQVKKLVQNWYDKQQIASATQELQGLLTSKYVQKGYKERMESTKALQSLLKAEQVQKEQEKQKQSTEELQGLLLGKKVIEENDRRGVDDVNKDFLSKKRYIQDATNIWPLVQVIEQKDGVVPIPPLKLGSLHRYLKYKEKQGFEPRVFQFDRGPWIVNGINLGNVNDLGYIVYNPNDKTLYPTDNSHLSGVYYL